MMNMYEFIHHMRNPLNTFWTAVGQKVVSFLEQQVYSNMLVSNTILCP